jgi:hypothetical protein
MREQLVMEEPIVGMEGPTVGRVSMEQEEKMTEPVEFRPSNQGLLRDYEITIRFLSRGCIVRVGCKEIPFEDVSRAMDEINAYVLGDTYEAQKNWRKLLDM